MTEKAFRPLLDQCKEHLNKVPSKTFVDGIMKAMNISKNEAELLCILSEALSPARLSKNQLSSPRQKDYVEVEIDI